MTLQLFGHPFSSYTWKVLIALYENGTPFEYRNLEDEDAGREWAERWPIKRFPVLEHGGDQWAEERLHPRVEIGVFRPLRPDIHPILNGDR